MKSLGFKLSAAILAFIIGVGSAYLVWLAYEGPVDLPPLNSQLELPRPISYTAPLSNAKSAKEEFEELAMLGGCTLLCRYYSPRFESYDPEKGVNPEAGIFYGKRWVAFFRRDKSETVPFLLSQIQSKAKTNVHVDPYGQATRGELAVYCLQYILKVNWYKLKKEYQTRFDKINYEYTTDQALLQKIIGTKRGAQEMSELWRKLYEQSS
jgi:hypothetical protein